MATGYAEGYKMKVIGFQALHYGADYIRASIRSVLPFVDEFHIAYTPIGSHGHRANIPCPDTRIQLYALAKAEAGTKLIWHDGTWQFEGEQRNSIYEYVPDADVIVVVDSDEVYQDELLERAIPYAYMSTTRFWRLPFVHYWRSFYQAFTHDPAYPIRIICPKNADGTKTMQTNKVVNHFGYAQRSEIVRYKLLTHGHKNEFRKDCDWFNDVFMANRQTDCHPVGSEYWNVERINPFGLEYLPMWMHKHPYANMELIP